MNALITGVTGFAGSYLAAHLLSKKYHVSGTYLFAAEKGIDGEVYNIGSGISYKVLDILNKLIRLSSSKIEIKKDKDLFRPNDIPELICDAKKFRELTGWKPTISIDETLKDTLDYWRNII